MKPEQKMTCALVLLLSAATAPAQDSFRPRQGEFPSAQHAKMHRGELVFVDHVNRRGSIRLHVDGVYKELRPHPFAMLPYGMIYYRGAPAELRDIPIGTVLYGRFFLPPDPQASVVPVATRGKPGAPLENHAILLQDGPSLCLREGKTWTLKEVSLKNAAGELTVELRRSSEGEGLEGEHQVTIDRSTRIWRDRELLDLNDLVAEGSWPENGTKTFADQQIYLALAWHPRYTYQQFHASDIWLNEAGLQVATERQRQIHIRHIRHRWMPAWVDSIEYGEFGDATVKATLFGGMDESLYADFKVGSGGQMAAAENTLRTYWPDHDGMEGKIEAVTRAIGDVPLGSSGLQISFSMNLVLEGFRPGRIVRVRPNSWPKVKPPKEELIDSFESRWPSPDVFDR